MILERRSFRYQRWVCGWAVIMSYCQTINQWPETTWKQTRVTRQMHLTAATWINCVIIGFNIWRESIWFGPDQNLINIETSGITTCNMNWKPLQITPGLGVSRTMASKQGLLHCNPSTWWLLIGNWGTNVNVAYFLAWSLKSKGKWFNKANSPVTSNQSQRRARWAASTVPYQLLGGGGGSSLLSL